MSNRNCLTYWFPKLVAAGLPVPRTEIVRTALDLSVLCDGGSPPAEAYSLFISELEHAAVRVGAPAPVFLRTGQGSGKHNWAKTCSLTDAGRLRDHVGELVLWSHLVDFFGLSHDVWVLREMLPVEPVAVLPAYGNMPLVKEVRCFVRGGAIVCSHPYWPALAIADGFGMRRDRTDGRVKGAADSTRLAAAVERSMPSADDLPLWRPIAEKVAKAFADDGAWSVDLLATRRGWFVTDMAEAGRSFHWDDCPRANDFRHQG